MMVLAFVFSGAGFLMLPGLARPFGRRFPPDEWARLCALALGGGGALVELGLALYAAPTVLRAVGVPMAASMCERILQPPFAGNGLAGWAAVVAAVALAMLAVVGLVRARRARQALRVEPWLGQRSGHGRYEVVVLPTERVLAVSVVQPAQIVISDGLVAAVSGPELEAILRHEAAHLDHRHDRYLLLAVALDHAFRWLRPVRHSTGALRVALERWADEAAAGEDRLSRATLRRAIVRAASALVAPAGVAALNAADTVEERIEALDATGERPTRLSHLALYLPGSVLLALVGVAQAAFVMAGVCAF